MTLILGLTGGIASGKSTVSRFLAARGAVVEDGDLVARRLVRPHSAGLARLVAVFGSGILDDRGQLKQAELGRQVFGNPVAEAKLNAALSPLIHREILFDLHQARLARVPLVVLDLPLLYEGGYQDQCDAVMVVTVSPATQLARLMARNGYDRETAKRRIAAQWPLAKKAALADVVIDNEGSRAATEAQVLTWLARWWRRRSSK